MVRDNIFVMSNFVAGGKLPRCKLDMI